MEKALAKADVVASLYCRLQRLSAISFPVLYFPRRSVSRDATRCSMTVGIKLEGVKCTLARACRGQRINGDER